MNLVTCFHYAMVLKLEGPISYGALGPVKQKFWVSVEMIFIFVGKEGKDAGHEATISRQSKNLYKLFQNKEMNSENLQAIFLKQHHLTPINYQDQL